MTTSLRAGHLPGLEPADVQWHACTSPRTGARCRSRCRCSPGADAGPGAPRRRRRGRQALQPLPVSDIVAIIDRAIARLLDPRDPVRRQLDDLLPV
jgi:hypothetical protein